MRNPINLLSSLQTHSTDRSYTFERLYRSLYNPELFLMAYQNIYASQGNMTKGTDGKTIDAMSLNRIEGIIASLKDESYQPQPSRRTYIPKKNGKMRPLGIPSFDDKLVQECVRLLLEAIYEGSFSKCSHGFRPKHSCHTALKHIQTCFTGVKWFVEGDIKGFFDNIDHEVMVLNFYLRTDFDVDAMFGTHVCTAENDDWLNAYVNYDMAAGEVCDELEVDLHWADGREEAVSYTLNAAEKEVLLLKMDEHCQRQTGQSLKEYSAQLLAEAQEPELSDSPSM